MINISYVRVKKFCEIVGEYTPDAVDSKIRKGVWVEGIHYRRAPDGHILINLPAFERWVEGKAT